MIRKNAWLDAKTTLLPQSCRWITRDPIGLDGGENAYEFCSGNPLMLADPSGLEWTIFGFEFSGDTIRDGLETSTAALGSSASMGFWDGGRWKDRPGFRESRDCWTVAQMALSGSGATAAVRGFAARATGRAFAGVAERFAPRLAGEISPLLSAQRGAGQAYRVLTAFTAKNKFGLVVHHIVQNRFAKQLGMKSREMASIILSKEEHLVLDNLWRKFAPYGGTYTNAELPGIIRQVYRNYPELMNIALKSLGGH